jgi:hypothetical protein
MMECIEFPMHRDDSIVALADILAVINPGRWTWRVLDFDGVGIGPGGMWMSEFDRIVHENGYLMNWQELNQFASGLDQTWDCLIVALTPDDKRSRQELLDSKCADAEFVIEGVDSDSWEVCSKDQSLLKELSNTMKAKRKTD